MRTGWADQLINQPLMPDQVDSPLYAQVSDIVFMTVVAYWSSCPSGTRDLEHGRTKDFVLSAQPSRKECFLACVLNALCNIVT